jgi:hypothetical protein
MRLVALISTLLLLGIGIPHLEADDLDRLIHDAASGSQQERLQALQALGNSGNPRALQPLLAALRDEDPTIRDGAIAALQLLVRTLRGLYHTIAQWIEELLVNLGVFPSPSPPEVEWTRHLCRI